MSNPFLTEIRIVSFNFAPKGWALCNGQTLPINQNQAIFALLGTTYGGNGQTTFALPNLQGRVAMHMGQGFTLGQAGGQETHTVTMQEMPAHMHQPQADPNPGTQFNPPTHFPAGSAPTQVYSPGGGALQGVTMNPAMITNTGGSQPHENRMPYTVMNFVIALQGIFPSQN